MTPDPEQRREIRVLRDSFPERGVFDTAVSRALLQRVAQRELPETLRIHAPGDVLAFSAVDRVRPGFARAVAVARRAAFEPVLRLAGGRAAVFHTRTLGFSWCRPLEDSPLQDFRTGVEARFAEIASVVVSALRALGVDARVGEVPGEYCPGEHSVNARDRVKLMGVGQRIVRGAAHVGGVVVVGDSARARDVLEPVYSELGFDFDPETVGSVEDEVGAVSLDRVADALLDALGERYDLRTEQLSEATLEAARIWLPKHRVGGDDASNGASAAR